MAIKDFVVPEGVTVVGRGTDYMAGTTEATSKAYDEASSRIGKLPKLIKKVYDGLRNAGRERDAYALRDAAERFAATGTGLGVNAFGRAQALMDLQNRMGAAANLREADLSKAELDQLTNAQKDLANLDISKAASLFNQKATLFTQQMQGVNAANTFNAQQARQTGAPQLSNQNNSSAQADARIAQMFAQQGQGQNDPLAAQGLAANKALNAATQMQQGLQAKTSVGNLGLNWYDPNYVQRTMGNMQFLKGASDYLGRPISNAGEQFAAPTVTQGAPAAVPAAAPVAAPAAGVAPTTTPLGGGGMSNWPTGPKTGTGTGTITGGGQTINIGSTPQSQSAGSGFNMSGGVATPVPFWQPNIGRIWAAAQGTQMLPYGTKTTLPAQPSPASFFQKSSGDLDPWRVTPQMNQQLQQEINQNGTYKSYVPSKATTTWGVLKDIYGANSMPVY